MSDETDVFDFCEQEWRDKISALALSLVGLSAGRDPDKYLDLIADGETDPRKRLAMAKMSGCGLVIRGMWRQLGFTDARLSAPYEAGSVMHTIVSMAAIAGARLPLGVWGSRPSEFGSLAGDTLAGDVLYLGGASEHVATVMMALPPQDGAPADALATVDTIDGGQFGPVKHCLVLGDATLGQCVLRRRRHLRAEHGELISVAEDGTTRPVLGWIDFGAIAQMYAPKVLA